MLQAHQFFWRLFDEGFYGVLVAEPIAAGDGVIGVFVEAVFGKMDSRGATLSGHSVASHGVDLGHNSHAETGVGFRNGDGGPKAGSATADDKNIVRREVQHKC